jgi:broad specificity phosphatase PhoE
VTTVWLTRHAETSIPTVFHGAESDVGLSDLGRLQAAAAAEWFRNRSPSVVVSSAMRRAVDTAAPIAAACGVPHVVEPEFHERRVGVLSGTAFSSEGGPWPGTIDRWVAGDSAFTTPGAESFDDLRDRLLPAFRRITNRFRGERVVLVAHGVVTKVLLLNLLSGYGPGDWVRLGKVSNLAVSELVLGETGWTGKSLLQVPAVVASIDAGSAASSGEKSQG